MPGVAPFCGDARRLRRAAGDSRWRTLGRGRWATRAEAHGQHTPVRSDLVGLASFAECDLVFQDFSLVLVPGMRLYPFPRARREACVASLAPDLRAASYSRMPTPRCVRGVIRRGPQTSVRAKRRTLRAPARAKQLSRRPGNASRSADVGTIRSRSANEMETYKKRTEHARALRGRSAGGQAITSRACANASLQIAREAPHVLYAGRSAETTPHGCSRRARRARRAHPPRAPSAPA